MGPKEARTGEPREKERTAAFATNAETSVLVINVLFFFAAVDNVNIPSFILPSKKDFIAVPAFVWSNNARAAPVSIMFIPKVRAGFLLALPRRLTMNALLTSVI